MNRNYVLIPDSLILQNLVDHHILGTGRRCFVITDQDNRVVGLLTLHHLKEIPRESWTEMTTGQAMTPLSQVKWLQPSTPVKTALQEMDQDGVNQLPVIVDGQVIGMLTREDVISFLRTQVELGLHRNMGKPAFKQQQ